MLKATMTQRQSLCSSSHGMQICCNMYLVIENASHQDTQLGDIGTMNTSCALRQKHRASFTARSAAAVLLRPQSSIIAVSITGKPTPCT